MSLRDVIRKRAQRQAEPVVLILSSVWVALALPLAFLSLANAVFNPSVPPLPFLIAFGLLLASGILGGFILMLPVMRAVIRRKPVRLRPLLIRMTWDSILVTVAAILLSSTLASLIADGRPPYVIPGLAAGLTGAIVSGYVIGAGAVKTTIGVWWHRRMQRAGTLSTPS